MSSMKATINGIHVTAESGMTILQTARANGIHIPTLCDHPVLSPFGACRICLVEVEKNPKLLTSCTTLVTEGMVVNTNTLRVIETRKAVLGMLLDRHPLNCSSCSSNGKCELQDVAHELGFKESDFADSGDANPAHILEDVNPFYVRDLNKCILCGRCVRVCEEHAIYHAIDFQGRGINTSIQSPVGSPVEDSGCVCCGQCVQVCPVGALYEKTSVGQGCPQDIDKVKTVCSYCGAGCEVEINVNRKTGRIANVTTDYSSPTALNKGRACMKGRFAWQFVQSEDRLTSPLIREGDTFRKTSWDEALSLVAEKLGGIKEKHGGEALAFFSSARCTNEENYLMQRLAREVMGTNNIDHCVHPQHSDTVEGIGETLGGTMTNDFESITSADTILIIGSNTTENHPVIGSFIKEHKKKGNCTLIVCDPRKIEMAQYADVSIQQKSGSDGVLLNGLMHVILRDELQASKFIEKNVNNFQKLKETVAKYTPGYVSEITGVAPELIEKAARAYAKGPNSAIFYTMGSTRHSDGTDRVRSIANLALLCGMLGRPGTGVNPLRGQNNTQGACDTGCLPDVVPGYRKALLPATQQKIKELWGVDLPTTPGLSAAEMLQAAGEGKIKGMYIMGENSMITEPVSDHVRHALKKLDFLVVQDIFLTEMAEFAHVILPAASWGERDGTFTNTCRAVQRVRKAVDSPGEARPDWEILLSVAKRLGAQWNDMNSPETIFNAIGRIAPAYAGITYRRMEDGALSWPCPTCEHPGTTVLYTTGVPSGKADFAPCEWERPDEWPTEEYPFIAITGRVLSHYHSESMIHRSAHGEFIKEMYIEVNPTDAKKLRVAEGQKVKVTSRRGEICGSAKISVRVPAGTIFLPFHFSEIEANLLTSFAIAPDSKTQDFKVNTVKLERVV